MSPLSRWCSVAILFSSLAGALRADAVTDRKIEDAAQASYNFRAVLEGQVRTEVRDGVATLTGTVADREQKALAEKTVRDLPGVVGVDNRLEILAPTVDRADGWIALKIKSLLLLRPNVSARTTDVTVRDGRVTLEGTASSVAQRELTAAYAREVEGVRSVDNRIALRSPVGRDQLPRPAGPDAPVVPERPGTSAEATPAPR